MKETATSEQIVGTVLAVQANYYRVKLDRVHPNQQAETLLCTRRTRLKKIGQQVMVGDRVAIDEPDWIGERGAISEVFPRESELDRPSIANVDQIILLFALADPPLDSHQLTRFLVKAESTGLEVRLCLNKSDLVAEEERQQWSDRIQKWGYEPILTSATTGMGLAEIQLLLKDKISVLAGMSGVGKSSSINWLIPGANLRVAEVSGKLSRGRHTTRHVELFELPTGGFLADTPGFNQPDLDCSPTELWQYFPEAVAKLENASCQFSDCWHRDEPNCVVRGDWERYSDYLVLLAEAIASEQQINDRANPESTLKLKTKGDKAQYEPKLESKKYRRLSRKLQQQQLQQLYEETDRSTL
jgi:ribosome biogenesis GTPase / thiamine phosphate phosphatase